MGRARGASLLEMSSSSAHRMWRERTSALMEHIMLAKGVLDDFIKKQTDSGTACSSRLLEAKRGYDGLLKDVKLLQNQIDSHQEAMEAEKTDLEQTMDAIKEVEESYKDDVKKCDKLKQEAKDEKAQFEKE